MRIKIYYHIIIMTLTEEQNIEHFYLNIYIYEML